MNNKILIGSIIVIIILTNPISLGVDIDRDYAEDIDFDISVCIFTRIEGTHYGNGELWFIYPPSRIGFSAIIILRGQDLKLHTLRGVELRENLIGFGFIGKIIPCNETHLGQINGAILFGIHWYYNAVPLE
jgi:hypothetical protein